MFIIAAVVSALGRGLKEGINRQASLAFTMCMCKRRSCPAMTHVGKIPIAIRLPDGLDAGLGLAGSFCSTLRGRGRYVLRRPQTLNQTTTEDAHPSRLKSGTSARRLS